MAKPRYILTLQADHQADDPDAIRRLRSVLKRLLRGYRLRCVTLTAAEAAPTASVDGQSELTERLASTAPLSLRRKGP
jgi:hypothetical protein